MRTRFPAVSVLALVVSMMVAELRAQAGDEPRFSGLKEFNPPAAPAEDQTIAIQGGQLVDVAQGKSVQDAVLVIRGNKIVAVGNAA